MLSAAKIVLAIGASVLMGTAAYFVSAAYHKALPGAPAVQAGTTPAPPPALASGGFHAIVEPGGAVELSTPPVPGVVAAIDVLMADRAALRSVFANAGLGLVLLGADPLRPPRRVNPGDRYRAMEEYFRAANTAAAGAAMMTSTASVQVNVDAGPADRWADRVRLAHALGPTMIAIAANSPLLAGSFSGWRSARIAYRTSSSSPFRSASGRRPRRCSGITPRRTSASAAADARASDPDPAAAAHSRSVRTEASTSAANRSRNRAG